MSMMKESLRKKQFVIYDDRKLNIVDDTTRHYPLMIRKALAEKTLMEQVPIRILEGELIVGLRPQMAMPEYSTQAEKDWAWSAAQLTPYMAYGHNSPSYRMLLAKGLKGILDDIARLRNSVKDEKKEQFWQAAEIACNSVIRYAERYAEEAEKLCSQEPDEQRRKELEKIAGICRHVPAYGARTFYEALQSVWFIYSTIRLAGHTLIQFGRIDQYLFPFYEQDLRNGTMTKEDARKLLQLFWIKCNMTDYVIESGDTGNKDEVGANSKKVYMGTGAGQEFGLQETGNNMILGGLTPGGEDGTNELTYMCLDIAGELKLRDPIVSVRIHRNSPRSLLTKACQVLASGIDMPAFYNDEIIIPALQKVGISLQDARDYCNDGCIEVYSQGKSQDRSIAIWIDALKCLELALNNGKSYRSGITTLHIQVLKDYYATHLDDGDMQGPPTGEVSTVKSFDQVMENFKKQLAFAVERHVNISNNVDTYFSQIAPSPLLSAVIEGCVEKGRDHADGGAIYNNTGTTLRGIPNTAESLTAIKKLCFDEKKITLKELVEALKNDFEGKDDIRKMLMECPKWGDNDDYVDNIVKEISNFWYQEVDKYTNPRGGRFKAGLWATAADHSGQIAGASADGRKAGEPIATNLSPIKSRKGITSFLNSAAKVDYCRCSNSSIVDVHLMPDTLDNKEKIERLAALIRTYFWMGGFALSFNVVRPETLIEAQKHPEQYNDLLVRVHGYSAHFITLSREYQGLVIERAGGFAKSVVTERDSRD